MGAPEATEEGGSLKAQLIDVDSQPMLLPPYPPPIPRSRPTPPATAAAPLTHDARHAKVADLHELAVPHENVAAHDRTSKQQENQRRVQERGPTRMAGGRWV